MADSLISAVQAVKDKITSSAAQASPEELAYLGTALDRIGGRATVYEVVEIGDTKIAELTTVAEELKAAMELDTTKELTAFEKNVNTVVGNATSSINTLKADLEDKATNTVNTVDTHFTEVVKNLDTHASDTLSNVNSTIDAYASSTENKFNTIKVEINTAIEDLSSSATLAQQQALTGSLMLNYYFATN